MRPRPAYEPYRPLPPLRTVESGSVSAGPAAAVFAGLDGGLPAPVESAGDLCEALFPPTPQGEVPVAFFTDAYCPNCRSLADTLEAQAGIAVRTHQLPLLGPASVVAARAVLAAERQGAHEQVERRLRRAVFVPDEAYLTAVAEGLGLDVRRFLSDLNSDAVARDLELGAAVARRLGFAVVPATVIGRTVVVGDLPPRRIARIVADEAREPWTCALPA